MTLDETTKAKASLSTLSNSLDGLEAQMEPLFAQTLPEFLVNLDKIQQAKLQVVLPYLLYDMIFIYLKSRGIDPKTHPVVPELARVRQYFDKIAQAEEPEKKRFEMDKAAAGRFIKHAIAQAKTAKGPSEAPATTGRSTDVHVPIKITSKMLARAQYEKDIAMADAENEDEDECLEVWDSEPKDDSEDTVIEGPLKDSKEKGKQKAKDGNIVEPPRDLEGTMGWAKRRRPPMDPFAGYTDDT